MPWRGQRKHLTSRKHTRSMPIVLRSPRAKVKWKQWTNEQMEQSMSAVRSGQSGVNGAALDHGIPRTTLKDRLSGCVWILFEKRVAEESDIFIDKDYVRWLETFHPALLYTQWSLPMQFTSLSFWMSAFYCYGLLFYCSTEPCDDYSRVSIYLSCSGMISIFHPSCSRCISVIRAVGGHRFHYRCKVMLWYITHIYIMILKFRITQ